MKREILRQAFCAARTAQKDLNSLTASQKNQVEKTWDVEHAYYSSALEGSKIDRKEFEKLGSRID